MLCSQTDRRGEEQEGIDAEILGFDFDVDFVASGRTATVRLTCDAALRFRGGDALHTMDTAFIFSAWNNFLCPE